MLGRGRSIIGAPPLPASLIGLATPADGDLPVGGGGHYAGFAKSATSGLYLRTGVATATLMWSEPDHVRPGDHLLRAWNHPFSIASSALTLATSGTRYNCKIKVAEEQVITNIHVHCNAAGTAVTGLYADICQGSPGTKLGQTADRSADFLAVGWKTLPLVTPVSVARGVLDIGLWFVGTTSPTINAAAPNAGLVLNANLSIADAMWGQGETGLTTSSNGTRVANTAYLSRAYIIGLS